MKLIELLEKKGFTVYSLSKVSGVPKTTLQDLCSGKANIKKSQAITIKKIADALGVKMEDVMNLEENERIDKETGLPLDKSYLEKKLPLCLEKVLNDYKESERRRKKDKSYTLWDIYYGILQSEINCCEVEHMITSNQAWYLREKYLGVIKDDGFN